MQDTLLFSTKLTFPSGLSYVSPSPQSKGRFYDITVVGLANMLNLVWKHAEKEKKKENLGFFFCSVSFASLILNMCQAGTNVLQGREGGLQRRRSVLKRGGGGASSTRPYAYPNSTL